MCCQQSLWRVCATKRDFNEYDLRDERLRNSRVLGVTQRSARIDTCCYVVTSLGERRVDNAERYPGDRQIFPRQDGPDDSVYDLFEEFDIA